MEIQALINDHLETVDFPSSQVKSRTSTEPDLHSSSTTLSSSTHTLSQLPVELLEVVLSCLTDPISQRRLSQVRMTMCGVVSLTELRLGVQVCRLWRDTVARLRWLRLMSFERKLHLRLPLAGLCSA